MDSLLHHPALGNTLLTMLGLWPVTKIMHRMGMARGWAALWLLNLLFPLLGAAAVIGWMLARPWPALPAPPAQLRKTKIWGQADDRTA